MADEADGAVDPLAGFLQEQFLAQSKYFGHAVIELGKGDIAISVRDYTERTVLSFEPMKKVAPIGATLAKDAEVDFERYGCSIVVPSLESLEMLERGVATMRAILERKVEVATDEGAQGNAT